MVALDFVKELFILHIVLQYELLVHYNQIKLIAASYFMLHAASC